MLLDPMANLPKSLPHGPLQQVFPDIYTVKGQINVGPGGAIAGSRNMTVVREDGKLTLLNTVRLDHRGLLELDALGTVSHIVKLGSFHGRDDAFYVRRYPNACFWAPPGMPHELGVVTDRELGPESMPLLGTQSFVFATASNVEAIIRLDREGGILIPCDSLQNVETPDEYYNDKAKVALAKFMGRALIGLGWFNATKPE
ncbi:MAG: hypothetical protein ACI9MC_002072, partial [Kiritimatiellia bacterium]